MRTLPFLLLLAACSADVGEDDDDAPILAGKADAFGAEEGSPEALGVLALVNQADAATLRAAGVSATATASIVAYTGAGQAVGSLAELDAIPHVGARTYARLLAFAQAHGFVHAAACREGHSGKTADGEPVEICDALFADAPRIRPPADQHDGDHVVLHAALDVAGGLAFVDRDGARYLPVDAAGAALGTRDKLPAALRMPSNRNLYLLYRVEGTVVATQYFGMPATGIRVANAAPFLLLPGKVIDGAGLGVWEGTASRRLADGKFDAKSPVPIRIRFTDLEPMDPLKAWDTSRTLPDGDRWKLVGAVENWAHAVRAADGTCLPALGSLGDASPFLGAGAPTVRLYRIAGMHFPGDQVQVLDYPAGSANLSANGMGGMTALLPATLLARDPGDDATQRIWPHATPNGHEVTLRPVAGGGEACD